MTSRTRLVIGCLYWLLALVRCQVHSSQSVSVTVRSRLNPTGHWISQIGIEDEGQSLTSNRLQLAIKYEKKTSHINIKESTRYFMITITEPPTLAPGADYELFPGMGYYKYHPVLSNMATARKMCADEGAHLIIVNSEEEAGIVKTLHARHTNLTIKWAWVGIIEKGSNEYVTIFDDSFKSTGFTRWDPSEPNDSAPNNCIVISTIDGGLHDTSCTGGFTTVCEQELW